MVSPDGQVQSSKGEFVLDAAAARDVIDHFQKQRIDLVVDYEHQTLGGEFGRPDGRSPAAGWIKSLRHEAGRGLLAVINWVGDAYDEIIKGTYRYLSPVFAVDKKTRRPILLHSVALTNKPAIVGFPPISALKDSIPIGALTMSDEPNGTEDHGADELTAEEWLAKIGKLLGIDRDDATAILEAAWNRLQDESGEDADSEESVNSVAGLLGLKGDATLDDVTTRITTLKQQAAASPELFLATLRADAAELELQEHKACEVIDSYAGQGRLTEAMKRAALKRILDPRGDIDTKLAEFQEFMEAGVPVIIPQGRTEAPLELAGGSRNRQTVILTASHEYDDNPRMHRMVGKAAYINDSLREQNLGLLTSDERPRFNEQTP